MKTPQKENMAPTGARNLFPNISSQTEKGNLRQKVGNRFLRFQVHIVALSKFHETIGAERTRISRLTGKQRPPPPRKRGRLFRNTSHSRPACSLANIEIRGAGGGWWWCVCVCVCVGGGVFSKLIHAGVSFANGALICFLTLEGCESATDNIYKSGGVGVCVCVCACACVCV